MRLRNSPSPLIFLFLASSITSTVSLTSTDEWSSPKSKNDVGTKDAPVDGIDGKPHEGPFVNSDPKRDPSVDGIIATNDEYAYLKGKTSGPAAPADSKDGVMDDHNRKPPKEGTTGMEGGVSEKDKLRKAQEDQTGEKAEKLPEAPKETPPRPDSGKGQVGVTLDGKESAKDSDFSMLEKPDDLPERLHDTPQPIPESANKDNLDLPAASRLITEDEAEGLIQPLHSFLLSFTMILVSEVGDKTFLVACLMAMKHDRLTVFSAAFGALLVMTVLSAVLGHTVPALIPKKLTSFAASGLFFVFGVKMLREGSAMSPDEGVSDELHEVENEIAEKEKEAMRAGSQVSEYTLEMGTEGRKSRSRGRFPTPPRSPSTSPGGSPSPSRSMKGIVQGLNNLFSLLLSPAWVQTFIMTFLGEWGDRSQIATIVMAAGQDYWWVTFGAIAGHAICTGAAVIGGRAIAGRVSLRVVTIGGACAFIVFGFVYLFESLHA